MRGGEGERPPLVGLDYSLCVGGNHNQCHTFWNGVIPPELLQAAFNLDTSHFKIGKQSSKRTLVRGLC